MWYRVVARSLVQIFFLPRISKIQSSSKTMMVLIMLTCSLMSTLIRLCIKLHFTKWQHWIQRRRRRLLSLLLCWQLNLKSLIQTMPHPIIDPLLSLNWPAAAHITKTKWKLIKIYVHMLDLVTCVKQKFPSSHISFSFLGMWSLIHLWYVLKMSVRAKGNYLSGKFQSCAGLGQFSGMEDGDVKIVYLSNVVITSVRPPFEIPGFWITDGNVKAKVFS